MVIFLCNCHSSKVIVTNGHTSMPKRESVPHEEPTLRQLKVGEQLHGAVATESVIYFDYDSFTIRGDGLPVLWDVISHSLYPQTIVIVGHCDERGTIEYNVALGWRRANAVKNYISTHSAVVHTVVVLSLGEEYPVATEHDENSWQFNRRAVIKY